MHKFNRIRQVASWEDMLPSRDLSNNIEPSVYGGDAPYVLSNYFDHLIGLSLDRGHAHLTVALIAKRFEQSIVLLYCGHSTQYSHLFLKSRYTELE